MNKNLVYSALAAVVAAGAASCSSDDLVIKGEGQQTVMLSAQLPGNLSRAFGDGTTAKNLQCAVYEKGATTPLAVYGDTTTIGTATFNGLSANVKLYLAQGKSYDIVFWASATGSPYKFNHRNQTVVASYDENTISSDENLDAFYASTNLTVSATTTTASVELKRPFAQLNIGTNDFDAAAAAGFAVTKAAVKVSGVSNTFDLLKGTVGEASTDVTFNLGALPGTTETFPVDGYKYLAMNYVLVGSDNATTDVTLTLADENNTLVSSYTGVPVKANYRTNIFGALITNSVDHDVTINPGFGDTDNNYTVWDGVSTEEPQLNSNGDAYVIENPNEFAYFLANGGVVSSSAVKSRAAAIKKFELAGNINMGGQTLPRYEKFVDVQLVGNGYTISNFKVASAKFCGMFPEVVRFNASDVTFSGAVIGDNLNPTGDVYAGVICGKTNVATFDSVTVENSIVNGVNKVGGFVGYQDSDDVTFTNCTLRNTTINGLGTDGGSVGGILGCANGSNDTKNSIFENITIEGVTISAPQGDADVSRGNGYILGTIVKDDRVITIKNVTLGAGNKMVSNFTAHQLIGGDRSGQNQNITIDGENVTISAYLFITSAEDLAKLRDDVNVNKTSYKGKVVALAADIDLKNENFGTIGKGVYFTGTFDGRDHTISNFKAKYSSDESYVGFIGCLNGSVKNLTLNNVSTSGYIHVGALVGWTGESRAYISNINIIGDVKVQAISYVGGIVGKGISSVSINDVAINANEGSYIKGNNTIEANAFAGGICGFMSGGDILSNCQSNIDVYGDVRYVGGIAGILQSNSTLTNCNSSGNVYLSNIFDGTVNGGLEKSKWGIGGIAGTWTAGSNAKVYINNCKFTGKLSAVYKGEAVNVTEDTDNTKDCTIIGQAHYSQDVNNAQYVLVDGQAIRAF
jgi:hypothetical protein